MNYLLILAQSETASATTSVAQFVFGAVYMLVCIALIGSILMKIPKNDGMSGLTGGGGNDASFKGAKSKDDTIDTLTNGVALAFILMSIGLNYVF